MQHGDRRQLARAPHLYRDVFDLRDAGTGRKLISHGPARRAPGIAKTPLQRRLIDLDDDAVDLVAQRVALSFRPGDKREQLFQGSQRLAMAVDAKAGVA